MASNLEPGQRVREVGPTWIVTERFERPPRGGVVRLVVGRAIQVQWDAGQDQTGAPPGELGRWVDVDWLALEVVHVLRHGFAFCAFSAETPRHWPAGHVWVGLDDKGRASCAPCIGLANRYSDQASGR